MQRLAVEASAVRRLLSGGGAASPSASPAPADASTPPLLPPQAQSPAAVMRAAALPAYLHSLQQQLASLQEGAPPLRDADSSSGDETDASAQHRSSSGDDAGAGAAVASAGGSGGHGSPASPFSLGRRLRERLRSASSSLSASPSSPSLLPSGVAASEAAAASSPARRQFSSSGAVFDDGRVEAAMRARVASTPVRYAGAPTGAAAAASDGAGQQQQQPPPPLMRYASAASGASSAADERHARGLDEAGRAAPQSAGYWSMLRRAVSRSNSIIDALASPKVSAQPSPVASPQAGGPPALLMRRSSFSLRRPSVSADMWEQLRHRVLDVVRQQHVVTEVPEETLLETLPVWRQGDWSFYTDEKLSARDQLRVHPGVMAAVAKWWTVATHGGATYVARPSYMAMSVMLYRELIDDGTDDDARQSALDDWNEDSRGADAIGREAFEHSIFDLADMWTGSVDAQEYIEFLDRMLARIAKDGRWVNADEFMLSQPMVSSESDSDALKAKSATLARRRQAGAGGAKPVVVRARQPFSRSRARVPGSQAPPSPPPAPPPPPVAAPAPALRAHRPAPPRALDARTQTEAGDFALSGQADPRRDPLDPMSATALAYGRVSSDRNVLEHSILWRLGLADAPAPIAPAALGVLQLLEDGALPSSLLQWHFGQRASPGTLVASLVHALEQPEGRLQTEGAAMPAPSGLPGGPRQLRMRHRLAQRTVHSQPGDEDAVGGDAAALHDTSVVVVERVDGVAAHADSPSNAVRSDRSAAAQASGAVDSDHGDAAYDVGRARAVDVDGIDDNDDDSDDDSDSGSDADRLVVDVASTLYHAVSSRASRAAVRAAGDRELLVRAASALSHRSGASAPAGTAARLSARSRSDTHLEQRGAGDVTSRSLLRTSSLFVRPGSALRTLASMQIGDSAAARDEFEPAAASSRSHSPHSARGPGSVSGAPTPRSASARIVPLPLSTLLRGPRTRRGLDRRASAHSMSSAAAAGGGDLVRRSRLLSTASSASFGTASVHSGRSGSRHASAHLSRSRTGPLHSAIAAAAEPGSAAAGRGDRAAAFGGEAAHATDVGGARGARPLSARARLQQGAAAEPPAGVVGTQVTSSLPAAAMVALAVASAGAAGGEAHGGGDSHHVGNSASQFRPATSPRGVAGAAGAVGAGAPAAQSVPSRVVLTVAAPVVRRPATSSSGAPRSSDRGDASAGADSQALGASGRVPAPLAIVAPPHMLPLDDGASASDGGGGAALGGTAHGPAVLVPSADGQQSRARPPRAARPQSARLPPSASIDFDDASVPRDYWPHAAREPPSGRSSPTTGRGGAAGLPGTPVAIVPRSRAASYVSDVPFVSEIVEPGRSSPAVRDAEADAAPSPPPAYRVVRSRTRPASASVPALALAAALQNASSTTEAAEEAIAALSRTARQLTHSRPASARSATGVLAGSAGARMPLPPPSSAHRGGATAVAASAVTPGALPIDTVARLMPRGAPRSFSAGPLRTSALSLDMQRASAALARQREARAYRA